MSKIFNTCFREVAFLEFAEPFVFAEAVEDLFNVLDVCFLVSRVDENVVEIYDDKNV